MKHYKKGDTVIVLVHTMNLCPGQVCEIVHEDKHTKTLTLRNASGLRGTVYNDEIVGAEKQRV